MWLKRCDAAEHRHRRRRRRLPADDRRRRPSPGTCRLESLVLFAIIFIWTPPHFWALALVKSGDYAPRRHPDDAERRRPGLRRGCQILLYTLVLAPLGARAGRCSASAASPMRSSSAVGGARHAGARRRRSSARREGEPAIAGGAAALRLLDPLPLPAVRRAAGRARRSASCRAGPRDASCVSAR